MRCCTTLKPLVLFHLLQGSFGYCNGTAYPTTADGVAPLKPISTALSDWNNKSGCAWIKTDQCGVDSTSTVCTNFHIPTDGSGHFVILPHEGKDLAIHCTACPPSQLSPSDGTAPLWSADLQAL